MRCSSLGAPSLSDGTAQVLENRLQGAMLLWPAGTGWEGKHKMSLSSQAADGRRASPLAGFPGKDLQILAGSRAGSTCGKAWQAGGEAAGEIRTGHVSGGEGLAELWGQKLDFRSDLSAAAAL